MRVFSEKIPSWGLGSGSYPCQGPQASFFARFLDMRKKFLYINSL